MAQQQIATADLALIGCGYWGKNLARNFRDIGALHTLCDLNQVLLDGYGADYAGVRKTLSPDEVFNDSAVTKVAVAAPAALHYGIVKSALLAGKDVFVEKPLCLDEQQGKDLVDLAQEKGRTLMVGHLLQYHPCVRKLQELVAEGALGRLFYITSNRLNLGKIRQEENALWSFAPHDLSVILSLSGDVLPEQLRCIGAGYLRHDVADTTLTTMTFSSGLRAHIHVSWLNPFKEQKLTVVGSSGLAVFDDTKPWAEKLVLHRHYLSWTGGQVPTPRKGSGEVVQVDESEPLRNECLHFIESCEARTKPRTDGTEGLRVLQTLQAAQRSLETGGEAVKPASMQQSAAASAAKPDYFVHPTAIVDAGAKIGAGSKIWHFAHISSGSELGEKCNFGQNTFVASGVLVGRNVKVQNNVSIYTGTTIEDDVFLGPSCVLTNVSNPRSQVNRHSLYEKTLIRRGATIGANATIVCGITLGRYCFIGAGAVVTKDVPDYAMMVGTPARQRGWMSRHGHVLRPDAKGAMVCPESGMRYAEESDGRLRCLDLDEDADLPERLTQGTISYRDLK